MDEFRTIVEKLPGQFEWLSLEMEVMQWTAGVLTGDVQRDKVKSECDSVLARRGEPEEFFAWRDKFLVKAKEFEGIYNVSGQLSHLPVDEFHVGQLQADIKRAEKFLPLAEMPDAEHGGWDRLFVQISRCYDVAALIRSAFDRLPLVLKPANPAQRGPHRRFASTCELVLSLPEEIQGDKERRKDKDLPPDSSNLHVSILAMHEWARSRKFFKPIVWIDPNWYGSPRFSRLHSPDWMAWYRRLFTWQGFDCPPVWQLLPEVHAELRGCAQRLPPVRLSESPAVVSSKAVVPSCWKGPRTEKQWAALLGIGKRTFQDHHGSKNKPGTKYRRSPFTGTGKIYLHAEQLPEAVLEKLNAQQSAD